MAHQPEPVLSVNNLEVVYDDVVLVLRGVVARRPATARSSRCSAPTAPARRRCCARSPGCCRVHRGKITKGSIDARRRRHHRRSTRPTIVRRGHRAGHGGPADLRRADRRREPARRRLHARTKADDRASRATGCSTCSRVLAERRTADRRLPVRRRAADARDRPRADGRPEACCCSTSRRSASRPSSSSRSATSSSRSTSRARACCSSSRTPRWRSSIAHHGYVMETGKVVTDGPAPSCSPTRTSRSSTSASARRAGAPSATSRATARKRRWARDERACCSTFDDVVLRFGGVTALDGVSFDGRPGRAVRGHRPQRRRQDVDLQLPQRRLPPAGGLDHARRRGAARQARRPRSPSSASRARSRTSGCSTNLTSSTTSCSAAIT